MQLISARCVHNKSKCETQFTFLEVKMQSLVLNGVQMFKPKTQTNSICNVATFWHQILHPKVIFLDTPIWSIFYKLTQKFVFNLLFVKKKQMSYSICEHRSASEKNAIIKRNLSKCNVWHNIWMESLYRKKKRFRHCVGMLCADLRSS